MTARKSTTNGRVTARKARVDFDFDAWEPTTRPFTVKLGGRVYELQDPREDMDFRELVAAYDLAQQGKPDEAFQLVVREEDREEFLANKLPPNRIDAMFRAYNEHYNIDMGEASASSPS